MTRKLKLFLVSLVSVLTVMLTDGATVLRAGCAAGYGDCVVFGPGCYCCVLCNGQGSCICG